MIQNIALSSKKLAAYFFYSKIFCTFVFGSGGAGNPELCFKA